MSTGCHTSSCIIVVKTYIFGLRDRLLGLSLVIEKLGTYNKRLEIFFRS